MYCTIIWMCIIRCSGLHLFLSFSFFLSFSPLLSLSLSFSFSLSLSIYIYIYIYISVRVYVKKVKFWLKYIYTYTFKQKRKSKMFPAPQESWGGIPCLSTTIPCTSDVFKTLLQIKGFYKERFTLTGWSASLNKIWHCMKHQGFSWENSSFLTNSTLKRLFSPPLCWKGPSCGCQFYLLCGRIDLSNQFKLRYYGHHRNEWGAFFVRSD